LPPIAAKFVEYEEPYTPLGREVVVTPRVVTEDVVMGAVFQVSRDATIEKV
jgi:hypothetical protein